MITLREIEELADVNCTCKYQHPDFWNKCPACKLLDDIKKRIDENLAEDTADRNEHFERGRK